MRGGRENHLDERREKCLELQIPDIRNFILKSLPSPNQGKPIQKGFLLSFKDKIPPPFIQLKLSKKNLYAPNFRNTLQRKSKCSIKHALGNENISLRKLSIFSSLLSGSGMESCNAVLSCVMHSCHC